MTILLAQTAMASNVIYSVLKDYGEIGIVIGVLVLILFIIQIVLQYNLYGGIASFRLMNGKQIRESEPSVSIIVPLFSEDSEFLDNGLISFMSQDYKEFEVVLVYVGNNDDFFADVKSLQRLYPHLTPVHIDYSPRYPVSSKIALNVGIKSAKYDAIITSHPYATPASDKWLALLAKGFLYGDIVLGYSGINRDKGVKNFIFREHRFTTSLEWISAAIKGRTYSASRNALGFTKELYFDSRGYNHLSMNIGEDDLFVQKIATRDNVSVVLSPRAACIEHTWGGWGWWWRRVKLLHTTHKYYPKMATAASTSELIVRFLFFASAIASFVLMPWSFNIVVLILMLLRYLFVIFVMARNTRRLGERGLISCHFFYDFIEPVLRLAIAINLRKKSDQTWQ